jgi:hypothetical protein
LRDARVPKPGAGEPAEGSHSALVSIDDWSGAIPNRPDRGGRLLREAARGESARADPVRLRPASTAVLRSSSVCGFP